MRTADVVRHIQIVRASLVKLPAFEAVQSLAVVETWVLEGALLSDVGGIDPRVKLWIESHPVRPPEMPPAGPPRAELPVLPENAPDEVKWREYRQPKL